MNLGAGSPPGAKPARRAIANGHVAPGLAAQHQGGVGEGALGERRGGAPPGGPRGVEEEAVLGVAARHGFKLADLETTKSFENQ